MRVEPGKYYLHTSGTKIFYVGQRYGNLCESFVFPENGYKKGIWLLGLKDFFEAPDEDSFQEIPQDQFPYTPDDLVRAEIRAISVDGQKCPEVYENDSLDLHRTILMSDMQAHIARRTGHWGFPEGSYAIIKEE